MPALVNDMGKAVPSFYGTVKNAGESVKPKLPMFALLILGGVAVIFLLRNRSSAQTGPALTLNPSNDSDVSTIDNLTQAVLALTHNSQGGGATTPSTPPVAPPGTPAPIPKFSIHITGKTPVYNATGHVVKYITSGSFNAPKVSLNVKNAIDPTVGKGYFQIGSGLYLKTPKGNTAESNVAGHYRYS